MKICVSNILLQALLPLDDWQAMGMTTYGWSFYNLKLFGFSLQIFTEFSFLQKELEVARQRPQDDKNQNIDQSGDGSDMKTSYSDLEMLELKAENEVSFG